MFPQMNAKGDIIISRMYRANITDSSVSTFRTKILAAKLGGTAPPIIHLDNSTFIYTRFGNLWFVAATRSNVNPCMVLEFLFQKIRILKGYLGETFEENKIRNNMTLLYELFDETLDFGYPQITSIDVLKSYITLEKLRKGYGTETAEPR